MGYYRIKAGVAWRSLDPQKGTSLVDLDTLFTGLQQRIEQRPYPKPKLDVISYYEPSLNETLYSLTVQGPIAQGATEINLEEMPWGFEVPSANRIVRASIYEDSAALEAPFSFSGYRNNGKGGIILTGCAGVVAFQGNKQFKVFFKDPGAVGPAAPVVEEVTSIISTI